MAELAYARCPMRLLLALLAVLALAASPMTAAAAQAACGQAASGAVMAGMGMPDAHTGAPKVAGPCCSHGDQHKQIRNGCAQACAASCAVAVALPSSSASVTRVFTRVAATSAPLVSVMAHGPSGPERPPKSMV
jgi:hypothetical protein